MNRIPLAFALVLLALASLGGEPVADASLEPLDLQSLTGGRWFFCAMAQTIKIVGLVTADPAFVLLGALAGGIACGLSL